MHIEYTKNEEVMYVNKKVETMTEKVETKVEEIDAENYVEELIRLASPVRS
jgi:uncharacterized protein (DUF2164 family)